MTDAIDEPRLLSVDEAAALLRVPTSTVRWWIHIRRLPSYKVGKRRLLSARDLEAFLGRCRQPASDRGDVS